MKLRIWNEVATLFLVSIVFIVVLKHSFNWINGVIGFFGTAILLMIGIQVYRKIRNIKFFIRNGKNDFHSVDFLGSTVLLY